jgi:hypothetical protein
MGRIDRCLNCQEEKEILAHSLCATCYRRDERATKRVADAATTPDKHIGGLSKDLVALDHSRNLLLAALHKLNASRAQVLQILDTMAPNLEPLRFMDWCASLPDVDRVRKLNTEQQEAAEQFNPERLNTEQSLVPEQFSTEHLNTEQTETPFSVQESEPEPVTAELEQTPVFNVQDILPSRRSRRSTPARAKAAAK